MAARPHAPTALIDARLGGYFANVRRLAAGLNPDHIGELPLIDEHRLKSGLVSGVHHRAPIQLAWPFAPKLVAG